MARLGAPRAAWSAAAHATATAHLHPRPRSPVQLLTTYYLLLTTF